MRSRGGDRGEGQLEAGQSSAREMACGRTAMELPPEVVHALFRACAGNSAAVRAMASTCVAWRAAADDDDLWKGMIARRWGQRSVRLRHQAPCGAPPAAWRAVYMERASGRRLRRTAQETVDLSEVLGKRLAPHAFSLHPAGWALYTLGGKTMAAKITSPESFISLGFSAKVLATAGSGGGGGSFLIGRAGKLWGWC